MVSVERCEFWIITISCFWAMSESMLLKPTSKRKSDFKLVCQAKSLKTDVPISFYKSQKTGLNVIIAHVEGPLVNGFFTVVTEAHDDDGLPHTLEHLTFLGSEDYPYKGVLDLLANRCLADGTNAWTDTDHTAYTVKTGGSEGFLNLLPIYLDHMLYPTLTEAGFITEVYHVTNAGEDAGVVYSEMQARENTGSSRVWIEMYRSLFPKPSGYCSETGGIMNNLRESTSISKIRKYHKEMYRPENIHVIISGQIEPDEVFDVLSHTEDKILSKVKLDTFSRPWESPVAPLIQSVNKEIVFASDTEDTGLVCVGWRGPSVVHNLQEFQSMEILMEYLSKSSVSVLQQTFVEINEPLASEVDKEMLHFSTSGICLFFKGVPKNKTREIFPMLIKTLQLILDGTLPFDSSRMKDILRYTISNEQNKLESEPHGTVAKQIISHILYGYSSSYVDKIVNKETWIMELLNKGDSYWLDLLKKYLVDAPSVLIKGVPSINEANRLQEQERARVENRKNELGESGLSKLGDIIQSAAQANDVPPPDDMLRSVPLASVESVKFHSLEIYSNLADSSSGKKNFIISGQTIDLNQIPVKMQLNHVKSNFVQLVAILDTRDLSSSECLYLPLLLDLLLESPMRKQNGVMSHNEVVKQLNADTFMAETLTGISLNMDDLFSFGKYFSNVAVNLKFEMSNYEKGVQWLQNILFNVELTMERIKVKATKMLNSIGELKRKGRKVLNILQNEILFRPEATVNRGNFLRQEKFLMKLLVDVEKNPEQVTTSIQNIYCMITRPDRLLVQLSTNVEKLFEQNDLVSSWKNFLINSGNPSDYRLNVIQDSKQRNEFLNQSYITGLGSVESAFLYQSIEAIDNFNHRDIPALETAITYLTQLEGPMWKEIRGKGLAYHYHILLDPTEGVLKFNLGYAAQLTEAYKESIKLLGHHLDNLDMWNSLLFESAKSALMYEVINREAHISDVVQQAIYSQYRNVSHKYNREFLSKISLVTMEDMKAAAVKYLKPLLDPASSVMSIVCPPTKVKEVHAEFEKMGHNLEIVEDISESKFSQL